MKNKLSIIGASLSIIIIIFLLSKTNFNTVFETFKHITWPWIAAGLIINMAITALRAYRYRVLISTKVSFIALLKLTAIYNLLSNVMPMKTGELSYVVIAKKTKLMSTSEGLVSWIVSRILDLLSLGILFLAMMITVHVNNSLLKSAQLIIICIVTVLIIILTISMMKGKYMVKIAEKISNKLKIKSYRPVRYLLDRAKKTAQAFSKIRKPATIIKSLSISIVIWLLQTLLLLTVLKGLGLDNITVIQAISVLVILGLAIIIPIPGIGNIGTYEAGLSLALISLGVETNSAIAYAIGVHIISLSYLTILGIVPLLMFLISSTKQAHKV